MSAAAWLEGAELDLAAAREQYRQLRRALRDENFRRPLARLLGDGDRLRGGTSARLSRARKRSDTLIVRAVDRLWDACEREREEAMAIAYRLGRKRGVLFEGDERVFLEQLSRPVPPRPRVQRDWSAWRARWKRLSRLRTPALFCLAALSVPWSFSVGGTLGPWLVLGLGGVALSLAIAFKDPYLEPTRVQVVATPPAAPTPQQPTSIPDVATVVFWLVAVPVQAVGSLISVGVFLGLIVLGLWQLLR